MLWYVILVRSCCWATRPLLVRRAKV